MRISELAAMAGVSTRAVRHYHASGVLPEPARLSNGYRDYGAADLLRLLRVVRLTALGLTLAEVRSALAGEQDLKSLLADVVADIEEQQADLDRRRRAVIALMSAGDTSPSSPEVAALLAELAQVAPDVAHSRAERDLLELMQAATPAEEFDAVARAYRRAIRDDAAMAAGRDIDRRLAELADADPDDPRVDELAAAMVTAGRQQFSGLATTGSDAAWQLVLDTMSPAQRRCLELAAAAWPVAADRASGSGSDGQTGEGGTVGAVGTGSTVGIGSTGHGGDGP
jgi:DNA-binding transcriptional MerR regulator